MAKTRSHLMLRRGRSGVDRVVHGARKTINRKRNLFPKRNFTPGRRVKALRFIRKAKENPKLFGAFGTERWFTGLLIEMKEYEVVVLENVKTWFGQHLKFFKDAHYKISKRSKQYRRRNEKFNNPINNYEEFNNPINNYEKFNNPINNYDNYDNYDNDNEGIDLANVDAVLLNEVLVRLDQYFSGIHIDRIVAMVGGYELAGSDSGIESE